MKVSATGLVMVTALWLATFPAGAEIIVINNGLAPPNPANVIDAANSYQEHSVHVQNVGCDLTVEYPCAMPWGDPTIVEVVEGGETRSLDAHETSSVTMSGGLVAGLAASDASSVMLRGGAVTGYLIADDSSSVTMDGGSAIRLTASDTSHVTLSGGSVQHFVVAEGFSSVTMRGGSVGSSPLPFGELMAQGASNFMIIGTAFAVDGVPVGYGPIAAASGRLTGTLASGEPIHNDFCHRGCFELTGLITLAPEPDAALLFSAAALSVACLVVAKRRAKR